MALLRMELHSVNVIRPDRASECDAIFRCRQHIVIRGAVEIIRVKKIKAGVALQPAEQPGAALGDDVVPPHVRQTGRLLQRLFIEAPHPPLDPAEPGKPPLLAGGRENLHADADAENRNKFPQNHVVKRFAHARAVEQFHGVIERADAGHDELACAVEVLRTRRNRDRNVQPPVEVCESPDIPEPVIDDGDHRKIRLSNPSRLNMFAPRVMINMLFL